MINNAMTARRSDPAAAASPITVSRRGLSLNDIPDELPLLASKAVVPARDPLAPAVLFGAYMEETEAGSAGA